MKKKRRSRASRYGGFILAFVFCQPLVGCHDKTLADYTEAKSTENMITIKGEEGIVPLPAQLHVASIEIKNAPFMTVSDGEKLYCERNDGDDSRQGEIIVHTTEGDTKTLVYSQSPATRSVGTSMRQFYRHHGVGYSYEAVSGSYCNMSDFRCQVLNRAVVDKIANEELVNLLIVSNEVDMKSDCQVYSSVVDYIAQVNFDASAGGNLLFIKGGVSKTAAMFEEGVKEQYILHCKESTIVAKYSLRYADIPVMAKKYPELLTSSFRAALKKLESNTDDKSIDDFIYTYGTHVVVGAKLGANLTLDVQVDKNKFQGRQYEKSLSKAAIATLFKNEKSTEEYHAYNDTLKGSKCNLEVVGGDVSVFDALLGMSTFDNTNVAEGLLDKWSNSITFVDGNIEKSNVELVDMEVAPIWDFIPNEAVANRVEAVIMGNIGTFIDQLPNRNFISTSFVAHPSSVTCRVGNSMKTFNEPLTTDVISANRHVATICKEYVPEIDKNEKVYVTYPIYEGRVKLTDGLCLYNGKAYKVDYRYGTFDVQELDYGQTPISRDTIYMNAGVLTPVKTASVLYQKGHFILGCERPGGIGVDGSLQGNAIPVFKHFGHFYLDNKEKYDNLPNWEYTEVEPSELQNYPEYFKEGTFKNRMVRSDNYIYILNPTEIGYE